MGILICTLLIAGCTQTKSPVEKISTAVVITSQNTPGMSNVTPLPGTSPEITPRFRQGDIIDFSHNINKVPHLIILDYNNKTGQYQYDIIFQNENKSWGYRLYPEPRWDYANSVEKNESYLITHINMTDLETRYISREIFEKIR
jgi:hypothetical protein